MRISERGQITIPKHLRERFGLNHDVEVEIIATDAGLLIHKRIESKHPVDQIYGILPNANGLTTDEHLEEIRGDDNSRRYQCIAGCVFVGSTLRSGVAGTAPASAAALSTIPGARALSALTVLTRIASCPSSFKR